MEPPGSDDVIGIYLPDNGFGACGVVLVDEAIDGGLEVDDGERGEQRGRTVGLSSWVRMPVRPFSIGRLGLVRSSECICDFLSIDRPVA